MPLPSQGLLFPGSLSTINACLLATNLFPPPYASAVLRWAACGARALSVSPMQNRKKECVE